MTEDERFVAYFRSPTVIRRDGPCSDFFKILLGHQNCDHALQNQRISGDSSGFSQSKTEIPAPSSRLQVTAPGALGREAMKVTGFRVVQTVVYDYDASTGR